MRQQADETKELQSEDVVKADRLWHASDAEPVFREQRGSDEDRSGTTRSYDETSVNTSSRLGVSGQRSVVINTSNEAREDRARLVSVQD